MTTDLLAVSWPDHLAESASSSYPVMVGAVLLGAIIPVVPTGAVVSAAAVLAVQDNKASLLEVIALAAISAWIGDCAVYALFRWGRRGVVRFLGKNLPALGEDSERLAETRRRLMENGTQVLVVSRLIPGGRLPTLFAASAVRYPWSEYLGGGAVAALVWAVAYAVMGLLGGSLFANPFVAIVVTVVVTLLVSLIARWVQRWWNGREQAKDVKIVKQRDGGSADRSKPPAEAAEPAG